MSNYESIDFFTDPSLVPDPHPYFDYLRSQNPVLRLPQHGFVAVTGYDEATAVYKNPEIFSTIVALGRTFPPLPFTPEGDDINAQIDAHRSQLPDERAHGHHGPAGPHQGPLAAEPAADPERLKENEEFMWRLADRQLDEFLGDGTASSSPNTPSPSPFGDRRPARRARRKTTRSSARCWRRSPRRARRCARPRVRGHQPAGVARRQVLHLHRGPPPRAPRRRADRAGDREVPGRLHAGGHRGGPLGDLPVRRRPGDHRQAALAPALQVLADRPDAQQTLRDRPQPDSRRSSRSRCGMESPVKSDSRLARRTTTIGGVDIPAGTIVMVLPGAANRDPAPVRGPA